MTSSGLLRGKCYSIDVREGLFPVVDKSTFLHVELTMKHGMLITTHPLPSYL